MEYSGHSLEDRIRLSLSPLVEPLKIDSFLALMSKERARIAMEESQRQARVRKQAEAAAPRPQAPGAEAGGAVDDDALRNEVDAFMRRDEVEEAKADEVAEYLEMVGGGGGFEFDSQ